MYRPSSSPSKQALPRWSVTASPSTDRPDLSSNSAPGNRSQSSRLGKPGLPLPEDDFVENRGFFVSSPSQPSFLTRIAPDGAAVGELTKVTSANPSSQLPPLAGVAVWSGSAGRSYPGGATVSVIVYSTSEITPGTQISPRSRSRSFGSLSVTVTVSEPDPLSGCGAIVNVASARGLPCGSSLLIRIAPGSGTSYAPISHPAPCGRVSRFWLVASQRRSPPEIPPSAGAAGLPALRAALVAVSATVSVGPPLSVRVGANPGSNGEAIVPVRSPVVAVNPHRLSDVSATPTMLYPSETIGPRQSGSV